METLATDRQQREASLREQHVALERSGYDGHNRRSGPTTMRRLRERGERRTWQQRLRAQAMSWRPTGGGARTWRGAAPVGTIALPVESAGAPTWFALPEEAIAALQRWLDRERSPWVVIDLAPAYAQPAHAQFALVCG